MGHVELPAGHLPELRGVVEDLVERDGAEVPRHELDDRAAGPPSPRRCRRPAKPASAMGVSMTRLRAELLEHPLADLVGALVVADLFAHEKDAIVALHLLDHGLAEGLAESQGARHRRRRVSRRRALVGGRLEDRRASGSGLSLGELHGVGDLGLDRRLERLDARVAEALLDERRARAGERVALLVLLELGRRAVLGRVAHRVAAEAVGAHLDQRRQRSARARA